MASLGKLCLSNLTLKSVVKIMAERLNYSEWKTGDCIGNGGFGAVYEIQRKVFGDIEKNGLKIFSYPSMRMK